MNMNIQYIRRPRKQLSHLVFPLSQAHEEIIWFNIPVEKRFRMNKLNTFDLAQAKKQKDKSFFNLLLVQWQAEYLVKKNHCINRTYHLLSKHENCLQRELSTTEVKHLFKTRSKQIHYQNIVISLHSKPFNIWNPSCQDKT